MNLLVAWRNSSIRQSHYDGTTSYSQIISSNETSTFSRKNYRPINCFVAFSINFNYNWACEDATHDKYISFKMKVFHKSTELSINKRFYVRTKPLMDSSGDFLNTFVQRKIFFLSTLYKSNYNSSELKRRIGN